MKKYIMLFNFLFLLIIAGCGNKELIQEDFKKDIDQVINILDVAYEENDKLNEEEEIILDKFSDKYLVGKYLLSDGKEYEMNDLEKSIANDIDDLKSFTKSEEKLASEEDLFTSIKKDIDKNLDAKEIPEDLKGKYPTYEIYQGVHPQIKEDAEDVIMVFDEIVNGESADIDTTAMYELNSFIKKYESLSFEIDDQKYLLNDESMNVYYPLEELKDDVEEGRLSPYTIELFNDVKGIVTSN